MALRLAGVPDLLAPLKPYDPGLALRPGDEGRNACGRRDPTAILPALGRGFVTLSVIDAEGRSARTRVRLR